MNGSQWENGGHVFCMPYSQNLKKIGNTWRLTNFKALASGKKYTEIYRPPFVPVTQGIGGVKNLKNPYGILNGEIDYVKYYNKCVWYAKVNTFFKCFFHPKKEQPSLGVTD